MERPGRAQPAGRSPAREGSYVWDYDGTRYLDFSSQLVNVNIGHQHPKVVAAIQEQAGRLSTVAPQHANDVRGEAAKRIVDLAPPGLNKVFFTNGGADANENAIRMARLHTGKHKVLSFYRSYHGNTGASVTATGDPRRWPNEFANGHVHFFGPYPYRTPFWSTTEAEESERALAHLEQVIQFEGPATIAAILLETVVGTAGVLIPPPGYLEGVRALCDRYGIVWIADEVMCGFGRTGKWFAYEHFGAEPDLITFAKGSQLRVRPRRRRRHQRPDRGDVRRPGVPRRPHLLRPPAGRRLHRREHRRDEGGGHRRERRAHRRGRPRPWPPRPRRPAPRHRRGPRPRRVLGARPRHRPRDARAAGAVRREQPRR